MKRLLLTRLGSVVPVLLVVSTATFALVWFAPGDAAKSILGTNVDPAAYEALRTKLGLDRSFLEQYSSWLGHAVRGDLGTSLFTGDTVTTVLGARLGVTVSLVLGATLLCAVLGVSLGMLGALRGGAVARLVDTVSVLGMSIPSFWSSLLLISVFSVALGWLPATGYVPISEDPAAWLRSLVLPCMALSAAGVAVIAKQTRGAFVDTFDQEYVRAMRANGVPTNKLIFKHCFKNASISIVTIVGIVMITMLGGTVLVETIFALPGLGQLTVSATQSGDVPVLAGVVIYYTLFVMTVNLLVDAAYGWLNPKVRVA